MHTDLNSYFFKRKRYSPVRRAPSYVGQQGLQTPEPYTSGSYVSGKKSINIDVVEIQRNHH